MPTVKIESPEEVRQRAHELIDDLFEKKPPVWHADLTINYGYVGPDYEMGLPGGRTGDDTVTIRLVRIMP